MKRTALSSDIEHASWKMARGGGGGGGTTSSRRMAMRGEIVEVQGGHIVRSTGRKDRHSKVCTAKGPRDRRVRLSAHTAIQFYDVQDRLGYDRPSKAVDWLINKAKAAIDDLAKLPAWDPHTLNANDTVGVHRATVDPVVSGGFGSGCVPLGTDIDDTIKCLFPTTSLPETNSASIQFQNYPPDLVSRSSSQKQQDLRLSLQSLQSLQDPILLHHQQNEHEHEHEHEHLFSATTSLGFDEASYTEEHGRFNRMIAWNAGAAADDNTGDGGHDGAGAGGGEGYVFNSPSLPVSPPLLFGQSQYVVSQRGPLQSSNTPSIRAWIEPSIAAITDNYHHHHYLAPTFLHHHQSAISGATGFASGGFSGFRIPARIQGEEEQHDGVSDKPSSASSDSRH